MRGWYNKDVFTEEQMRVMDRCVEEHIQETNKEPVKRTYSVIVVVSIVCTLFMLLGYILGTVSRRVYRERNVGYE